MSDERPTPPTRTIPPMVDGVRSRIRDVDHLNAIMDAYYDASAVAEQPDGNRRHYRGEVEIVVGGNGTIIYLRDREEGTGPSEVFTDRRPVGKRRRAAGRAHAGHLPRTTKELLDRLAEEGCTITRNGGGHYVVTGPRGGRCTVSVTPSDGRGLRNTIADAQRMPGVNLRRGGTREAS